MDLSQDTVCTRFGKYTAKVVCSYQSLAFNFDKTCSRWIEKQNDSMIMKFWVSIFADFHCGGKISWVRGWLFVIPSLLSLPASTPLPLPPHTKRPTCVREGECLLSWPSFVLPLQYFRSSVFSLSCLCQQDKQCQTSSQVYKYLRINASHLFNDFHLL